MFDLVIFTITFIFLAVCAYTDLKTREIPDWVNYLAIAFGFGARLLYSTITWDIYPLVYGITGFIGAYILACSLYYTGQWGGGDSKALMAVGTLLGIEFTVTNNFFAFLVNLLIIGAAYSILWSARLALKNKIEFTKKFKELLSTYANIHKLIILTTIILFISTLLLADDFSLAMAFLTIFTPAFFYLFIFIKSVEQSCLLRWVNPNVLTEGDWVGKDVIIQGKKICETKDLGLTKEQIQRLRILHEKGKLSKVLLKTGIPFMPSFLLSFILFLTQYNVLEIILRYSP